MIVTREDGTYATLAELDGAVAELHIGPHGEVSAQIRIPARKPWPV
jgi:hypothetical protein